MSACTCTNHLYTVFTNLLGPSVSHQPRADLHPTTAKTRRGRARSISNQSWRSVRKSCHSVREKAVTRFWKKLVIDPVCPSLPQFWPDSHCLKTSNRRLTYHLASMHQISELLSHHFPPTTYRPTTSSRALTIELLHLEHFISGPKPTCSRSPSQPTCPPNYRTSLASCSRFVAPSSDHPTGSTLQAFREVLEAPF